MKKNAVKHDGIRREKETKNAHIITRCAFCGSRSRQRQWCGVVMIWLNRCFIYIRRKKNSAGFLFKACHLHPANKPNKQQRQPLRYQCQRSRQIKKKRKERKNSEIPKLNYIKKTSFNLFIITRFCVIKKMFWAVENNIKWMRWGVGCILWQWMWTRTLLGEEYFSLDSFDISQTEESDAVMVELWLCDSDKIMFQ